MIKIGSKVGRISSLIKLFCTFIAIFCLNSIVFAQEGEVQRTLAETPSTNDAAPGGGPLVFVVIALVAIIVAGSIVAFVLAKSKGGGSSKGKKLSTVSKPKGTKNLGSHKKPISAPSVKPVVKTPVTPSISRTNNPTPVKSEPKPVHSPAPVVSAPQPQMPMPSVNNTPAPVASTPMPGMASMPNVDSPSSSSESGGSPLFDSNQLDSDLDSIFGVTDSPEGDSSSDDAKDKLFDSDQLDKDLDALFIEADAPPTPSPVSSPASTPAALPNSAPDLSDLSAPSPIPSPKEEESTGGLFDSSQLDSDLDSLFSIEETESDKPSNSADLSSLFDEPKKEEVVAPSPSGGMFELDSLDFLGDEKEKDNLGALDLSSLSDDSSNESKFDLDLSGVEKSNDLGSLELSSLTSPATEAPVTSSPDQKIDLTTTTMGVNISDLLGSTGLADKTQKKEDKSSDLGSLDLTTTLPGISSSEVKQTSSDDSKKKKGEGIIAIGKMLVDQNALEEIIKRAEKGGKAGLTTTQVITAVKGRSLDTLLVDINNIDGILGSLIVGKDGLVIANTLPNELDKDLIGALTSSLFSNLNVQIRKVKRGELNRLTVETEEGIYILTEVEMGTLVVFSEVKEKVSLKDVYKAISTVTGKK